MESYDDIINLPRHRSQRHAPMPRSSRAAQFAPFAALTGFGEAVIESARLTDGKKELTEDEAVELNRKLCLLKDRIKEMPEASVTYFVKDGKKSGGAYVTVHTAVKRIDPVEALLETADGIKISLSDILSVSLEKP